MRVSFDFDGTLCDERGRLFVDTEAKVCAHMLAGDEVLLVTSRYREHGGPSLFAFLDKYNLRSMFAEVHFTEHQYKADTLRDLGVDRHYDDNRDELARLHDCTEGVFVRYGFSGRTR